MQITLFKALKSVNIDDASAKAVVDQLEEHIDTMISNATRPLEAKIDGLRVQVDAKTDSLRSQLDAKTDSLRSQLTFNNVLLGIIGLGIVAAPIIAKLIH